MKNHKLLKTHIIKTLMLFCLILFCGITMLEHGPTYYALDILVGLAGAALIMPLVSDVAREADAIKDEWTELTQQLAATVVKNGWFIILFTNMLYITDSIFLNSMALTIQILIGIATWLLDKNQAVELRTPIVLLVLTNILHTYTSLPFMEFKQLAIPTLAAMAISFVVFARTKKASYAEQ